MRYTLDKNRTIIQFGTKFFNVLDTGVSTSAYAKDDVIFSDECNIYGGIFHGGEFNGGEFNGGIFHDGEFHDGEFNGGVFRDGIFHGGVFRDGGFNGGIFHGGFFQAGWLPLQIQGSRHFVNIPDGVNIRIGCRLHSVEYWLKNFEHIGEIEEYRPEQIAEYKSYIDLAATMITNAKVV
ncbi:hypothetical protein NVP1081O_188 [Vibrio phage 1.081.O._10N.286.52.C2]|nr:hypothetical protein NVP1081O_188 [Vibrio phage 1.081.O._10N.286.52.C2]